jgi:hypothetical protein
MARYPYRVATSVGGNLLAELERRATDEHTTVSTLVRRMLYRELGVTEVVDEERTTDAV